MKRQSMILCAAALVGMTLVASSAHAQWGHYRVTSSYSLPSVPYAFSPVVVPVVQPTTAFSPVVVNQSFTQPFAATQPTIVGRPVVVGQPVVVGRPVVVGQPVFSQPVVVGRPVVVGQPLAPSAVVVRRGLFRRPVVVAPAAPVIVQQPIWVGP